jgi:hypothetical protein
LRRRAQIAGRPTLKVSQVPEFKGVFEAKKSRTPEKMPNGKRRKVLNRLDFHAEREAQIA